MPSSLGKSSFISSARPSSPYGLMLNICLGTPINLLAHGVAICPGRTSSQSANLSPSLQQGFSILTIGGCHHYKANSHLSQQGLAVNLRVPSTCSNLSSFVQTRSNSIKPNWGLPSLHGMHHNTHNKTSLSTYACLQHIPILSPWERQRLVLPKSKTTNYNICKVSLSSLCVPSTPTSSLALGKGKGRS
ncbi:uncharacterized protein K452DRAFT_137815 [Aplosporella prunicola CBS 121167]|uniref:Uncharacterized protein n=1 Tax=Aplosporella prunicola CBS 121167 TaxID=1176127 RepID=A0A6A6AXN4_9PEZI|nr:uncharacterized protein K452DRAFT_137815 [Aplosporella prunicola CBS 121167]KAF2136366.1 hypothetical protein K452DRAFT_137815 [Aplosporella prunicola CBS 121167]